ncbi:MAG TPA: hypothetical protein VH637_11945 [Streptosporangiaceae bacterium]
MNSAMLAACSSPSSQPSAVTSTSTTGAGSSRASTAMTSRAPLLPSTSRPGNRSASGSMAAAMPAASAGGTSVTKQPLGR